jgi:hypothetical protein
MSDLFDHGQIDRLAGFCELVQEDENDNVLDPELFPGGFSRCALVGLACFSLSFDAEVLCLTEPLYDPTDYLGTV